MAVIPEAVEGMQLSQRFSGAAQQLQADMDALRMSLETLDFGQQLGTFNILHFTERKNIDTSIVATHTITILMQVEYKHCQMPQSLFSN